MFDFGQTTDEIVKIPFYSKNEILTNYSEEVNIRTFGVLLLPINTIKNEIGSKKLFIHPLIYLLLKCCGLSCNFSRQ